jgi:NAD binding domain of 6-phosphogluconate dehydrogenase
VFLWIAAATVRAATEITDNNHVAKNISLIGLGGMGKAIAKCFMSHGYNVHAWNRTPQNKTWVQSPEQFTIHTTLDATIAASNVTFLVINSAPRLQTVRDMLFDENSNLPSVLRGKTVVNMVNHDPYSAQDLDALLESAESHHVASLMFGVPETVCSPGSHILVGASLRTTEMRQEEGLGSLLQHDILPLLKHLGQVHDFSGGGIGLASVVYLCLIQSLYFGLAGYELSLLILQKYLQSMEVSSETAVEILGQYQQQASTLLQNFLPAFLPIISNTIVQQQWTQSYVPAAAVIDMFELHDIVFEQLELLRDSYHTTYTKYLRQTIKAAQHDGQDAEAIGVSAVVQHYSTSGRQNAQRSDRDSSSTQEL